MRGGRRPDGLRDAFYSNGRANNASKFTVENMQQQFATLPTDRERDFGTARLAGHAGPASGTRRGTARRTSIG